ncbi:MAG: nucleoside hydrolase [Clostridia bacterium]|nr:nucleoside hydrolase [Clostridia bacterium]
MAVNLPIKVIIDTDPGIDDAVALALAVRSPELEIVGVTTCFGNNTVDNTFQNACYILSLFRPDNQGDIPVYQGASAPLSRPAQVAKETHGDTGLGYLKVPSRVAVPAVPGPLAMLHMLEASEGQLSVIALGPLTNLALALGLNPSLMRKKIKEIILMGGSALAPGNITPVSEFNFWADPEAAQAVFASGIPIRMVGLDVTRKIIFSQALVSKLVSIKDNSAAQFLGQLVRFYVDFHREREGLDGCVVNDALAIALVIHPEWGQALPLYVEICTYGDLTRGQSIADYFGVLHKEPNAMVYLSTDALEVIQFILDRTVGPVISRNDIALTYPSDASTKPASLRSSF